MSTNPPRPLALRNRTTPAQRPNGQDRVRTACRDIDATEWRAGSPATRVGGISTPLEESKRTLRAPEDGLTHPDGSVTLDRLLESLQREHLTPIDLRVLLRVTDHEATVRELANSIRQPTTVLRRASTRLMERGLLRRRRRRSRRGRLELTVATSASGMTALRRVARSLDMGPNNRATSPGS